MSERPLLAVLRLCRVGTWFSPAADVVASCAMAGIGEPLLVARAAAASVCVYGAGMVLNDVADRRVDAVQRPERPLPSGALSVRFAATLGVLLLAAAIALSPVRVHHGLLAVLVLAYDFGSKRFPLGGVLLMGLLRAGNLATGVAISGTALATEARQPVLIAVCCYGLYIVAVTVLGIFEDSRTVSPRAVAAVQAAPPLLALAGVYAVQAAPWPAPALLAVPALWFLWRNSHTREWSQGRIRQSMMYLLLGTMLYTASLALAAGQPWSALGIVAAIPVARRIARSIALT
ncbi:MAG: UbiA family prenyltransferase [Planctomycetes bacterium]|nr:UbiA family prenyltransferase [Planctomycetota bacterium]